MKQPTLVKPPKLNRLLFRGMDGLPDAQVRVAQELLLDAGYFSGVPRGNFGPLTEAATVTFQMQHIDEDGNFLKPDGVIGRLTWWALHNHSGAPQANRFDAAIPRGITGDRRVFLEAALAEKLAGTREDPLGTNWGDGVTRFLQGIGPAPWCMFFVSELFRDVRGAYPFDHRHGHCVTFWNEARRRGVAREKGLGGPRPGDIGIMRYFPSVSGHAFIVLRVSEDGRRFNTIGGNESQRVKLGLRNISQDTLLGFVNLWGDSPTGWETGVVSAAAAVNSLRDTR